MQVCKSTGERQILTGYVPSVRVWDFVKPSDGWMEGGEGSRCGNSRLRGRATYDAMRCGAIRGVFWRVVRVGVEGRVGGPETLISCT